MAQLIDGKVVYSGGEALPAVGSAEYNFAQNDPAGYQSFKQANPGLTYTNEDEQHYQTQLAANYSIPPVSTPISTISADTLKNIPTPVRVPNPAPLSTTAQGLLGKVEANNGILTDQQATEQAQNTANTLVGDTTDLQAKKSGFLGLFSKYFSNRQGETALTDTAYSEDNGTGTSVDKAKQELTDITNQINEKTLAHRREREALINNFKGTTAGLQATLNDVDRKTAMELADLSIIQQAKSNNYANAKEIADRKVKLELEQDKNNFDALQFFYNENKDELNKKDDQRFQLLLSERSRLLTKAENEKKAINDIALEALKNGASQATAQRILTAPDQQTALSFAGNYVGLLDRNTKYLQMESLKAEIENKKLQNQKLILENTANSPEVIKAKKQEEIMPTLSLIDSIMNSPYLDNAVGIKTPGAAFGGFLGSKYGSNVIPVVNQIKQLQASLSLENRQKLKGSGAISDFEARTLTEASSAFSTGLGNEAAKQELRKIRGALSTASGLRADVKITDPKTNQSQIVNSDRAGINKAIADGLLVEYQ